MRVKLNKNPTVKVEIIDDAESTPGVSRQQTRFKFEVKKELEQTVIEATGLDAKTISNVLEKHNFKLVNIENLDHGVLIDIKSMEK